MNVVKTYNAIRNYFLHNIHMDRLHKNIRTARKEAGLSQQKVADALNVDRVSVTQYESENPDIRTVPPVDKLLKIARLTGWPICKLVGLECSQAVKYNPNSATCLSEIEVEIINGIRSMRLEDKKLISGYVDGLVAANSRTDESESVATNN